MEPPPPQTGEKGLKRVVQTFVRHPDKLIHISVAGARISATEEHPFYVAKAGWNEVVKLCTGDKLLLRNSKVVIIEVVQLGLLENLVTV